MKIQYVVTDARRYCVEPVWCAKTFDILFYHGLIDKAWGEISYAIPTVFLQNKPVKPSDYPPQKSGQLLTPVC